MTLLWIFEPNIVVGCNEVGKLTMLELQLEPWRRSKHGFEVSSTVTTTTSNMPWSHCSKKPKGRSVSYFHSQSSTTTSGNLRVLDECPSLVRTNTLLVRYPTKV